MSTYISDIYLLRHGETDLNKNQLTQGVTDAPLNEAGLQQAEEAGEKLRKMGLTFDYVFSSPLVRASKTGQIVSGLSADDPRFIIVPELCEMNFGVLEGKPFLGALNMVVLNKDPASYTPPEGGESFDEIFARMDRCLQKMGTLSEELYRKQAEETGRKRPLSILAASHGMAMRVMLSIIRRTEVKDIWKTIIGNCDVFHLRLESGAKPGEWIYTELPKTLDHGDPYDPHVKG